MIFLNIFYPFFFICYSFPRIFPAVFHPFFIHSALISSHIHPLSSVLHPCFIHNLYPLPIHYSLFPPSSLILFNPCSSILIKSFHACSIFPFPSSFHPFFILFSFQHQCLPNFIHCHPLFIHISSIFLSISIHFSFFIIGVHQFLLLLCFPPFIIQ